MTEGGHDSLRARTLSGLGWSGFSQVLRQALQFGISILLARILAPNDFGLLAMVLVFAGFASTISDLGLSAALIQRKKIQPGHVSTAFCLQLTFAAVLSALLAATAPWIASFYDAPALAGVSYGLAPTFLLHALGSVPIALLLRRMAFRSLALIEATSILVSGGAAVVLALNGWGIWSLVAQALLAAFITAALAWQQSRWRPCLAFSMEAWRELRRFSSALTGFNVINYWIRNLDNLIVGKFIGTTALGLYSRAYGMMIFPIRQVGDIVSRVMLPAMSSIQDQNERFREIYLKSTRTIALITFPFMAGMAVLADLIIVLLYGRPWSAAADILRLLTVVGLLQSIGTTIGWIYSAKGRTDIMFYFSLFSGAVYSAAFLVGVRWGVQGVAAAYALSFVGCVWYPSWTLAGRLIGLRFSRQARNLGKIFCCTVLMAGALTGLRQLPCFQEDMPSLLALTASGAVLYFIAIRISREAAYHELVLLLREQLAARGRRAQVR